MQYNERLDAELKALEGDMIETLQRWIRVPSVRAERSADNAPFGENVRRALDTAMADLKRLGMEPRDVDGYCCDTEIGQGDEVIARALPAGDFLGGQALHGSFWTLGSLAATFLGGQLIDGLGVRGALGIAQLFALGGAVLISLSTARRVQAQQ